jgi:hypothetical protein
MRWFARAKKTEVLATIDGWGKGNPQDKNRTHSWTDLQIEGKPFATVSHRQSPTEDGTVSLTVFPGTGLPEEEAGSVKGNLRIARENMPSFQVVSDD